MSTTSCSATASIVIPFIRWNIDIHDRLDGIALFVFVDEKTVMFADQFQGFLSTIDLDLEAVAGRRSAPRYGRR